MKFKKKLEIHEEDGVPALREALKVVPDDADYSFLTSWVGYGPSERQEVTGIEFEWTEEI